MFESGTHRQRLHLLQGGGFGLVRGHDLPVAEQVHHRIHHVVGKVAVNHPGRDISLQTQRRELVQLPQAQCWRGTRSTPERGRLLCR